MYRTEEIYQKIKNTNLKYPICVPSYDRPNSPFIEWVKSNKFDIPKDNLFVFIRNTPEQKRLYRPLKNLVNLVLISKDTKDIGDTREQIVRWGQKHNHELLFMLDDTIKGIWWLSTVERKGNVFLDIAKKSSPKTAFQIWATEHIKNRMVATGIGFKGFHWMSNRVNKPIEALCSGTHLAGCIAVSPMEWLKNNVNYTTMADGGCEELYVAYELLKQRLPFCELSDFCFEVKTVSYGGNNVVVQSNRDERMLKIFKTFWEKTLGLPWGMKHPGFSVVKGRSECLNIRINLAYWRKYYANTE